MILAIGSYNKATDPGIHLYRWEASEKKFRQAARINHIENPSYISIDNARGLIYAITEKKEDNAAELHIYQVTDKGQKATLLSCIPFQGAASCNISTDPTRTHAFITNYGDGTLTVIELPDEIVPGRVVQHVKFSGSGPDKERQDQSHPHAAILSKDERRLYCSDLGTDRLYHFAYHPGAKVPLHKTKPPYIQLPAGSGPRHIALSQDGRRLYVITELSGEIFVFDTNKFNIGWLQKVSLHKAGFRGKIEAADIQINHIGSHLYACTRGDMNEIIVFSVEVTSGRISILQRISAFGVSPRSLLLCEQEGLLLAANEQSDNVSIFTVRSDGTLENYGEQLEIHCPTCVKCMIDK